MNYWIARNDFRVDWRAMEVVNQYTKFFDITALYSEASEAIVAQQGLVETNVLKWREDEANPIPSFVTLHAPALCLTRKKFLFLERTLNICADLVTSRVGSEEYVTLLPKKILGTVDLERSNYRVMRSGSFGRFSHLSINLHSDSKTDFFHAFGPLTAAMLPIVSDNFKTLCQKNKLSGLRFSLVETRFIN